MAITKVCVRLQAYGMSFHKEIDLAKYYFLVFQASSSCCIVLLGMIFMTKNAKLVLKVRKFQGSEEGRGAAETSQCQA